MKLIKITQGKFKFAFWLTAILVTLSSSLKAQEKSHFAPIATAITKFM